MEKALKVLVDTDILIKAYRGDDSKIENLKLLKDKYCISIITAIELIAGSKNIKQFSSFNKALKAYSVVHLNEGISIQAFQIYKNYTLKHELGLSDCFIAATALKYGQQIYTDNKKHYNFIEGIKFYKEK